MTLLKILKSEKDIGYINGIYKQVQVLFTHNSNKIEGSKLTLEQTRSIFEYNTIDISSNTLNINDIIETTNHFQCIDYIINNAARQLSESIIKKLHKTLYTGINLKNRKWFKIGEYKKKPNTVADIETTTPEDTPEAVRNLLLQYNSKQNISIDDIIDFHVSFERIHPFQDGNGRVGRLIMFKECLKYNIVPFIIEDEFKQFYYRDLREYRKEKGFLVETCLAAQDKFKKHLDYFKIPYK